MSFQSRRAGLPSAVRQRRARRALTVAASLATGTLFAAGTRADGTATSVHTGDKTWNAAGTWIWTGDTGNQVYPGDGVGPAAGTEAAITQGLYGTRTLNISTNAAAVGSFTIGSFTHQQAQNLSQREFRVNYQGSTNEAKFTLNTSLIQHLDAPGVLSAGGTDGLNGHLIFNSRLHINGGNLVVNSDPGAGNFYSSNLNFRGNIATKFDDSDVSFTNLTLRGARSFEIEDNAAIKANWNFNGTLRLEGTGQFRLRYAANGNNGDEIVGTTGLTTFVAAAPNGGWANALFERATGGGVNRLAFDETVIQSNLFYDPNNAHVSLGNVRVSGKRVAFIWDGYSMDFGANGTDYTGFTGDADSELLIAGGATWQFNSDVQSTMLGKVGVYDATANFNGSGSMGHTGVADRHGMIQLNTNPLPTDRFEVRNNGILRGHDLSLPNLTLGANLTLADGAIIAHEALGSSAMTTATVQGLGTTPRTLFGLGVSTNDGTDFDITVGAGSPWAGIASDRNVDAPSAKRWHQGVITANGDFSIASGRNIANNMASFYIGNGSNSAGGVRVVNASGSARVNANVFGRVDFDDDQSDFSAVNFVINNQTEARFYGIGAMGSATATVRPGGVIIASSAAPGSDQAFNGNVHVQAGGTIQINARDTANNAAGLNGTGTITRDPGNIIIWLNNSEALSGTQFGPQHVRDGDLIRVDGNDIKRLDELANVTFQVKQADRSFANGLNLNGGRLVTDHASRQVLAGGGNNTISVGPNGTTFAASSPTLAYADPNFAPLLYNGSGNIGGGINGTQTLTINALVNGGPGANASSVITIGSPTPIDGLNMNGHVVFNQAVNFPGSINKITSSDLIFNAPGSVIAGDVVSNSGGPGTSPNVKFGNNATTISADIVSGNIIGGSLIMRGGTKTDLNIDTASNNGPALSNDNRLDVNLKLRVEGGMSHDGKRIYVDRRDSNTAGAGLINLAQVTIAPDAVVSVDEANTDVRIKNPTVLGNFTVDRGSSDPFEFENLAPATPVTITNGVVSSNVGTGAGDIGLFGTTNANVTVNNIRGTLRLENGAVFNGTVNTGNVPTGGDSFVRVLAGANGNAADRATGSGVVNLGGTNAGAGAGFGEDLYVYVNDDPSGGTFTNVFGVRVNVGSGVSGTLGSDRGVEIANIAGGRAEATNVHLQENATLYFTQGQDTTLVSDLVLEGNATLRKNDGDATANRIYVRSVTGAFDATVNTGATNRALTFIGNATNNRLIVGSGTTASAIQLDTGANLPSVEAGSNALVNVNANQTASVARLTSANAATNAVNIAGRIAIRPATSDASSTTSVVKTLNIAGSATPTGTLDLGAYNRLAVDYTAGNSPIATVRSQILAGYAGGAWNGPGITSSSATGAANLAIGYGEASDLLGATGGTFGTATVDGDTLLLRTTVVGDATLNGAVDFNDLVRLAQNYNTTDGSAVWAPSGDFTYDGNVDFNDLVKLAQNYGGAIPAAGELAAAPEAFQADLAAAFASVPEPGALGLIGLAACSLAGRRRRRAN